MAIINFDKEIDNYIESLDRKELTKHSYKFILNQFINFLYKKKILLPNKRDIISYKEYLAKRVGSATIQKTIVVLRGFFRYLKMNDKYDDIMYGIRGLKIEKTFKRNSLEVEEVIMLINLVKEESNKSLTALRNYAFISLMITTGLRTIEIVRANVKDVMPYRNKYRLYIQGKGHDDKDSYVKLSDEVYEIIISYLSKRNDEYEPLFINHHILVRYMAFICYIIPDFRQK